MGEDWKARSEGWQARCHEAERDRDALRSRVAELVTAAAGYRGKMQDAQARVAELEDRLSKLAAAKDHVVRERDEARADCDMLRRLAEKAYTDTQVTVDAATLRAERAEAEVERLRKELEEWRQNAMERSER